VQIIGSTATPELRGFFNLNSASMVIFRLTAIHIGDFAALFAPAISTTDGLATNSTERSQNVE